MDREDFTVPGKFYDEGGTSQREIEKYFTLQRQKT